MNVRVSVIVPVYNVEAYVEKCIDSILSQTYKNYELIVLNDGSIDRSYEKLLKYENNPYVTIINKENTGQSDTRYQGLLMAKGEYVYFVDSDDFIEPYTLEKLIEQVDMSGADVVLGRYRLVDKHGNILREQKKYSTNVLNGSEEILRDAISFSNFKASLWLKLIKKNLFVVSYNEEVRGLRVNEDMYLSIALASKCEKIIFIDDIIYNVLQREGSVSRTIKPELISSNESIYKKAESILKSRELWEVCKKDFYYGYLKAIVYCLGLAAIKCNSYDEYKLNYELLSKDTFFNSSELNIQIRTRGLILRIIFFLSKHPKAFYILVKLFTPLIKY